ncbi:SpoVA/SpoVAEb family sporulation membrane protein [uncultured Ruminococcus sp.]|uniref:SpoVA/SpoVAEb family sporulation membrane protein n=1 Tax=uncultured Ruminococcus sp. TaxID=165186 RepID=UPI0025D67D43|nr:SpoVA/SpoVAEb family sporulation membrane protein [uncultured Ruminococcus sp.]
MNINLSKTQYSEMYKEASHGTKWWITIPKAFFFGGLICMIGQSIFNMYSYFGLDKDASAMATSVSLVFLAALFTGLGWYDRIAKHAGAGTLVPITGFANSVAAPALEFKTEGMILGLGAKIFIISGPVILYGTLASIVYGIIYYFFLR